MKGSELLDKMELADPAYVEAADAAPRKARHKWVPWVAAAACLCAAAGLLLLHKEHPRPDASLAAPTTAQQPSTHPAAPSSAAPSTAEPTEETVSLHFNDVDPTPEADFARLLDTLSRCAQDVSALSRLPSGPVPEYFDRTLTLSEARADALFGAYLPSEPPVGFAPESIRRFKDQKDDTLSALWCSGYDELRWKVYRLDDETQTRLTTAAQTETYDLSLYPIPRAESVPEALRAVVDCPVFPAQELSIDVVMARAYRIEDAGDGDGWRMHFAVLYDDIVVEVTAKGVEPAWLCAQLTALSGK